MVLIRTLLFILVILFQPFSYGVEEIRKKVFVTAFEPFGGTDVNYSKTVAEVVQKKLSEKNVDVEVCILPVVYDQAAEKAKECYNKISPPPVLAFSFGEGDCSIRMETAAHNLDDTPGIPDNDGNIRVQQKIYSLLDKSLGFQRHVLEMYCSTTASQRSEVTVSESPGGYVCNNTAFQLGLFFKNLNIPYSFIHVPANACGSLAIAKNAGETISSMIESTSEITGRNIRRATLNKYCSILPTSLDAIEDLLIKLNEDQDQKVKKICEREFLNKLKKRIERWGTGKGLTY